MSYSYDTVIADSLIQVSTGNNFQNKLPYSTKVDASVESHGPELLNITQLHNCEHEAKQFV